MSRQRVHEIDGTRGFEPRQMLAAEGDEVFGEPIARLEPRGDFHRSLDFFAELLVRNTEDRRVVHRGMVHEHRLDLRRVDVHARPR